MPTKREKYLNQMIEETYDIQDAAEILKKGGRSALQAAIIEKRKAAGGIVEKTMDYTGDTISLSDLRAELRDKQKASAGDTDPFFGDLQIGRQMPVDPVQKQRNLDSLSFDSFFGDMQVPAQ